LESALASPRAEFSGTERYPTLHEKAAVLVYRLAKCQACLKGNKRIALILFAHFLYLNGWRLSPSVEEAGEPSAQVVYAAESNPEDEGAVVQRLTEWVRRAIEPMTRSR
jgi:death-on-curing protein